MDQLTAPDTLRYEKLKKEATQDVLAFRASARQSAATYPKAMRKLVARANTNHTPAYLLLSEWETRVAPEVDTLRAARQATPLRSTLAKQLRLSNVTAADLAKQLVDERISNTYDTFLDLCYGSRGKARTAARTLLTLPDEELRDIKERFISYELHQLIAKEQGITVYDRHASLLKRLHQKRREKRQVNRYKKQQAQRLEAILARQQEIKTYRNGLISRILLIELDTVVALDAQRQYKKQLDKLKPADLTPAKRLSLFAAATKKIRADHTSKQSTTDKLADLQSALQVVDEVLVELFDMTDTQRNTLMARLKEYRDLDREAARITKEQTAHS